jgi:hypothetical protein
VFLHKYSMPGASPTSCSRAAVRLVVKPAADECSQTLVNQQQALGSPQQVLSRQVQHPKPAAFAYVKQSSVCQAIVNQRQMRGGRSQPTVQLCAQTRCLSGAHMRRCLSRCLLSALLAAGPACNPRMRWHPCTCHQQLRGLLH